jgi:hypothetical protein
VNGDLRWLEASKRDGFFDPKNDIVSGSELVVAEIMIEAQLFDSSGLKKDNYLGRPMGANPAFRSFSFIIKKYAHIRSGTP